MEALGGRYSSGSKLCQAAKFKRTQLASDSTSRLIIAGQACNEHSQQDGPGGVFATRLARAEYGLNGR